MEHFRNPFAKRELASARVRRNHGFLGELLTRAKTHRFFSERAFYGLEQLTLPSAAARTILASFYQVVRPFTGLLCTLAGRAPNLRARFALMDNIYEEMGCGELTAAHPALYLNLLASIGVSKHMAERLPASPAIERINQHLRFVIERAPFSVGCAVLASAESTIPASFPVLAGIARNAFRDADMTFFERHGERDEGHSGDASMLFALNAQATELATAEAEVTIDLDHRSALNDEWLVVARSAVHS